MLHERTGRWMLYHYPFPTSRQIESAFELTIAIDHLFGAASRLLASCRIIPDTGNQLIGREMSHKKTEKRIEEPELTKKKIAMATKSRYNDVHMKLISRYLLMQGTIAALLCGAVQHDIAPAAQESHVVNRIAATVNGRPITSSEVRARLTPYLRELIMLYPKQGPRFSAELVKAKKAVINDLIERELVLSEFETKGFMMPESVINEEINRRILYQFNGQRSLLLETLRQSGMTLSDYRESIRKETTVAAMRSSRYDRGIPPTPDEIQAEYNATKSDYRDITQDSIVYEKIFIPSAIPGEESTPEQLYALAIDVQRQIESKKISFANAARKYSRDMHAENGGLWPAIKRKDLAVEFSNIVFSAEPGKVIGPLLDPAGFTIVRVRSKHLAPAPPLSQIKEQIDDSVRRKQSEKRYREWITRLRDKAVIRTFI